ncbi:PilX N-terminal domain-containing pilus assembly protein [Rhodocyclaceae bacterium SMB388]
MAPLTHRLGPSPRRHGGAATLLIALILLAAMTLGSVVAQRSLVADQTVAGNYLRSSQARMAAEAGLELTAARLRTRSGRAALLLQDDGIHTGPVDTVQTHSNDALSAIDAESTGFKSAAIALQDVTPDGMRFSMLRVDARGCWREALDGAPACEPCSASCPNTARTSEVLAFAPALLAPPVAALTLRGQADLNHSGVRIANTDTALAGLTVHAGGAVINRADHHLMTLPGTPPAASLAENDAALSATPATAFFYGFFGTQKQHYRLVADERLECAGHCSATLAGHGGAIVWVDIDAGRYTLQDATLGSPSDPVILVVDGALEIRGATTIHGLVYAGSLDWHATPADDSVIVGAAIVEDDFSADGVPRLIHDAAILQALSAQYGSFVRVPGTWRDF